VAAVNGRIFISFIQAFKERLYYDAFLKELQENGIQYSECGENEISVAEIEK
jgi:hypothetical protein